MSAMNAPIETCAGSCRSNDPHVETPDVERLRERRGRGYEQRDHGE
jgi:hypothetical protein